MTITEAKFYFNPFDIYCSGSAIIYKLFYCIGQKFQALKQLINLQTYKLINNLEKFSYFLKLHMLINL